MKQIFLTIILTALFCLPIFAQTDSCVKIESEGGANVFTTDEPARFRAVSSKEISTIGAKYIWKLSAGKITSGENTDSILIDLKESGGRAITATVETEGVAGICPKTASFTFEVVSGIHCDRPVENWGNNLKTNAIKARLDNVALTLTTNPDYIGYVISVRGESETFEKVQSRLKQWKKYLIESRGVSTEQIVFVLVLKDEKTVYENQVQIVSKKESFLENQNNYVIID